MNKSFTDIEKGLTCPIFLMGRTTMHFFSEDPICLVLFYREEIGGLLIT